jgi:hypothetical protein
MRFFRRHLRHIFLPLVAMILAIQAFAVAHEVRHDIWGHSDNCPICSVASHATSPAPTAPVIATVAAYVFVVFTPTYEAPRLVSVTTTSQPRAPPVDFL